MEKPKQKTADPPIDSTTGLIEVLCEISANTADAPLSGKYVEELERRLKLATPTQ
jgi:hypothetical protein